MQVGKVCSQITVRQSAKPPGVAGGIHQGLTVEGH